MPSSRPNILMIQADQLSALALGCYGHPIAKTPHINGLADEGVLFANSYCNCPLCCPSRSSMVTGRYPHRIGSYDNSNELPASEPTFMHVLRNEEYRLWLSGKMHFVGPDQLHGFHGRMNTDIYPSDFGWTPDWENGPYSSSGTSVRYLNHSGTCRWSLQLDYDEETASLGLRCLRDLARLRARDGNPFFLCVSFTHPHDPFHVAREYWDLYEGEEIPPPNAPAEYPDSMHPYNRWIQTFHEIDRYPPEKEAVQSARRAYLGMISYIDEKVGQLVTELKRLGIDQDTAVVFTSDHGDMQGEHGMWFKRTFFEWSTRVPLIFRLPGTFRQGKRVEAPVSLVDLFPTFAELGSAPAQWPGRENLDGNSLIPLLTSDSQEWNHPVLSEYCGEGSRQPMRMIRFESYKYVIVPGQDPLLFDLQKDQCELDNLAGRPELEDIEKELRVGVLKDWNSSALRQTIVKDQQKRLMLKKALAKGTPYSWDYQPFVDASEQYVRKASTQYVKSLHRLPHLSEEA